MPETKTINEENEIASLKAEIARQEEITALKSEIARQTPEPEKKEVVKGLAGNVDADKFAQGERNLLGNIWERPGAAVRGAIQSTQNPEESIVEGFNKGSNNPADVPRFQDMAIDKTMKGIGGTSTVGNFAKGLIPSTAGLAGDILTNPADMLALLLGKTPTGKGTTLGGKVAASKFGQAVKGVATKKIHPVRNIKETVSRFKVDFINENLFPRVAQVFAEKVNTWSKGVQAYAKRRLKMPEKMINHIGKRTVEVVRAGRKAVGDSLDNVALNIQKGFTNKLKQSEVLYKNAFASLEDDSLINIERAYGSIKKVLFKNGFVDKSGKLTKRASDPLQDKALRRLASEYKFLSQEVGPKTPTILGPKGQFLPSSQPPTRLAAKGINKHEWNNLKNAFSEIAAENPGRAKEIGLISDALHSQAEEAGLEGIKVARKFFRKHMEHIDTFKTVNDEGKLAGFFKQGQKERNLNAIDKYLNSNNTQFVKDVLAGRSLESLDNVGIRGAGETQPMLQRQLNSAADPKNIKSVKRDFFEDILGKDKRIDRIFNEISGYKRSQAIRGGTKRLAATGASILIAQKILGSIYPREDS